ncbi:PilZ domain-containing protein [Candidatus Falkowbacteria bacterium]|nr:PilZ domain-containing protein [Candidatus Falkowbacteria bacterium]
MAENARRFLRVRPATEISVLSLNGVILIGRLVDISEGGARLASDLGWHHNIGDEISIAFMLSDPTQDKRNPVFARTRVVWNFHPKYPRQLGVKFEEILPSHRYNIRQFVGKSIAPN